MAITSEAQLIAARAAAKNVVFRKNSVINATVGLPTDLYRAVGFPAQPPIPAAAVVCDASTPGALPLPFSVVSGNQVFLDAVHAHLGAPGQLCFVDRVIHSGGINTLITTTQAINTPPLPARAPAVLCRWYLVCWVDVQAVATSATVTGTYTDSTLATFVIPIPGSVWRVARKLELLPAAGKFLASVQTVTLSASSSPTPGDFGVVCEKSIGIRGGTFSANTLFGYESLVRNTHSDTPCITANFISTSTNTGAINADLVLMQG
ncbi:MAG: hypothetical protein ACRCV9_16440 [Burkholderiaceae bacterium]